MTFLLRINKMEPSNHLGKKLQKKMFFEVFAAPILELISSRKYFKVPRPITNLKNMIVINWHFSNESYEYVGVSNRSFFFLSQIPLAFLQNQNRDLGNSYAKSRRKKIAT